MAAPRKDIDWLTLEVDYRANIKSIRALSEEYGISKARIGQVADEKGWERDLSAKIALKAQAKLDRAILDAKLDAGQAEQKRATEADVIEANSDARVAVILESRTDIQRYMAVGARLVAELEAASRDEDTLSKRADTYKKLADTYKILIGLKRQAFGIADNAEGDKPQPIESMEPRELARRIAFALSLGLAQTPGQQPTSAATITIKEQHHGN